LELAPARSGTAPARNLPPGRRRKLAAGGLCRYGQRSTSGKWCSSRAEDPGCRRAPSGAHCERTDPLSPRSTTATGITLHLSDELAARLAEEASRQSVTPEELATHVLADYIVIRPHHGPATIHPSTGPAAEPSPPKAGIPGEPQGRPRRTAIRLMAEIPSLLWLGLFLLFYAAMFILIVVLIAKAL